MIRRVHVKRREGLGSSVSGVHPVVGRVLSARGAATVPDYSLAKLLPPTLGGLEAACEILEEAIRGDQRIVVVGDFDADGATGTALAVRGLKALGAADVHWRVPDRFRHGYGLGPTLVGELTDLRPDLVLTVDQGVSSHEGVAMAREAGMRVIVTDHHLPGDCLPPADAIVNPNLSGERFGSTALAGVGVVFYLLMALRSHLRERGRFGAGREPRLDQWLDLVALGTVADLVPLDENNRRLVQQGLLRIRAGRCLAGIRALLEVAGRNLRHVDASDMGFAAGPRLNAAGRLEDMGVGIRCLLADSESEAVELAARLDALNRERQSLQADMQEAAEAQAQELAERIEGDLQGLCVFDSEWHQGVVGLVAGRLVERLQRPVIAFAPAESGGSELKGSGRSPSGVHMRDLLVEIDARHPGLIERFGGHARAAGLSLPEARLDAFRQAFDEALSERVFEPDIVHSDGALSAEELSLETATALAEAGPWGQAWPEPLFDGRFRICERRVVGSHHLKLRLEPEGGGPVLDAIAFGAGSLCHRELPDPMGVVYELDINRWQGRVIPQMRIRYLIDSLEG
ncbi:single-stranded-DNA-specific exonuclease RecJ [Wenzhouxiangella sediminis]|uniref:single-stranded-DNA-specific exonuclease RecJ n=1 Tax=Wenzhouxiangella sediminis TaxID=1792836 RepID=UPI001FEA63E7|nr:single-stranded-DNA-specific exonuclease RecJ [Wenzhouxiangella sediminis]